MKKVVALLVGVVLVVPSYASAQSLFGSSPSATATVKATVLAPLTIDIVDHINFGSEIIGEAQTVTLDVQSPIGDQTAGEFEVVGQAGQQVVLTINAPQALSLQGGGAQMDVLVRTFGSQLNGSEHAGEILDNHVATLNDEGGYFIYVGGDLDVGTGQTPGDYQASYTVSVAYN